MSELEPRIRTFVLQQLTLRASVAGVPEEELNDGLAMIESGLLDSMAFVELINDVETEFDFEIDFEDLDPARIAILGDFIRTAAKAAVKGGE